jgi:hypothetical protein
MPVPADLLGQKFGRWKVLGPDGRDENGQGRKWLCECECGLKKSQTTSKLRRGETKGCTKCAHNDVKNGYTRTWFWHVEYGAKKRGIEFRLTPEHLKELLGFQEYKCALTGLPISFADTAIGHRNGETTASLDRIDSSKGYVEGNVQWVHKHLNVMKSSLSQDQFVDYCRMVVARFSTGSSA